MNEEDKITYLVELKFRILADLKHFNGAMPEATVYLWRGYLAATLETSILTFSEYKIFAGMLPQVPTQPIEDMFTGRHDPEDPPE
jgi:hypothetical protein